MKSFRAHAAASVLACIAFGTLMGATHTLSAPAPGTATHSVLAGTGETNDDSGWGGRYANGVVTEAAGLVTDGDSGWGSSGS
ncbi:hypothetical protein ABZ464_19735 [Streptomyces sp. NPDC005820]|uniref:hypothetical protein n=1 Tax=Streptomyces sp. NPDC005820 TaxID=3157069 RepID=UPI0033D841C5